jgi:hypothetical protein
MIKPSNEPALSVFIVILVSCLVFLHTGCQENAASKEQDVVTSPYQIYLFNSYESGKTTRSCSIIPQDNKLMINDKVWDIKKGAFTSGDFLIKHYPDLLNQFQ